MEVGPARSCARRSSDVRAQERVGGARAEYARCPFRSVSFSRALNRLRSLGLFFFDDSQQKVCGVLYDVDSNLNVNLTDVFPRPRPVRRSLPVARASVARSKRETPRRSPRRCSTARRAGSTRRTSTAPPSATSAFPTTSTRCALSTSTSTRARASRAPRPERSAQFPSARRRHRPSRTDDTHAPQTRTGALEAGAGGARPAPVQASQRGNLSAQKSRKNHPSPPITSHSKNLSSNKQPKRKTRRGWKGKERKGKGMCIFSEVRKLPFPSLGP